MDLRVFKRLAITIKVNGKDNSNDKFEVGISEMFMQGDRLVNLGECTKCCIEKRRRRNKRTRTQRSERDISCKWCMESEKDSLECYIRENNVPILKTRVLKVLSKC